MAKTGLVLEGGGLRGVFSGGVIDCFLDHDISFDYVIGVSAGSCCTFSYVAKARGYIRSSMIQPNPFESYIGIPQMLKSHRFVDLHKIFYDYTEKYGFDFQYFVDRPIEWEMVVSNIDTGKPEYMHTTDIEKARRIGIASCSLPGIMPPVEIDGRYYLDGGVCDVVPSQRALEQGCDRLCIVLTRKKGNFSHYSEAAMKLYKQIYGDKPEFYKAMCARNDLYKSDVEFAEQLESEGTAMIIRPTYKEVNHLETNEEELSLFYYHGYTKAEEYIDELLGWQDGK